LPRQARASRTTQAEKQSRQTRPKGTTVRKSFTHPPSNQCHELPRPHPQSRHTISFSSRAKPKPNSRRRPLKAALPSLTPRPNPRPNPKSLARSRQCLLSPAFSQSPLLRNPSEQKSPSSSRAPRQKVCTPINSAVTKHTLHGASALYDGLVAGHGWCRVESHATQLRRLSDTGLV